MFCVSSCSKDNDDHFVYPIENLHGSWEGTEIGLKGDWFDVTGYFSNFKYSISFYSDGSFYAKGYFGTGSGTYETSGKKIILYLDKQYYRTLDVISLTYNKAHFEFGMDGSDEKIGLKLRKK